MTEGHRERRELSGGQTVCDKDCSLKKDQRQTYFRRVAEVDLKRRSSINSLSANDIVRLCNKPWANYMLQTSKLGSELINNRRDGVVVRASAS